MVIQLQRSISPKAAAIWGAIFCLPFIFAFATAMSNFQPFIGLTSYNGRATTFGLIIFYVGLIGLPLAFLVNFLAMFSMRLKLSKWSVEGKIGFHPKPV